jgi:hypothetical protein
MATRSTRFSVSFVLFFFFKNPVFLLLSILLAGRVDLQNRMNFFKKNHKIAYNFFFFFSNKSGRVGLTQPVK